MADFPSAGAQLPNSNWSPQLFHKDVLLALRTLSVADEITSDMFYGTINGQGSEVVVIKEPQISVTKYKRGGKVTSQDLVDEKITLVIDQALKTQFQMDDIEVKLSHISWAEVAKNNATYKLNNEFDTDILLYMYTNATEPAGVGSDGTPIVIGFATGNTRPLNYIAKFSRLLDEADAMDDGNRFFVGTPAFYEALFNEDSSYIAADVMGDSESGARTNKVATGKLVHRFKMYKSNNLAVSASSRVTVLAGHKTATSVVRAMDKAETLRSQDTFADIYRSLLVFGRKVIRPEILFRGHITINI